MQNMQEVPTAMGARILPPLAIGAAALLIFALAGPAAAARTGTGPQDECRAMLELYRDCHRLGLQTGSAAGCQEAALDLAQRAQARAASKNPQAARALAELVCSTGCDDALGGQPPATQQEFAEAFCETAPKPQGARP